MAEGAVGRLAADWRSPLLALLALGGLAGAAFVADRMLSQRVENKMFIGGGCQGPKFPAPESTPPPPDPSLVEWSPEATRVTAEYRNGEEAARPGPLEELGGGVGVADLDGDGLADLVATQGGGYGPGGDVTGRPTRVFFGNLSEPFAASDLVPEGGEFFTHGVALGDYDRDGLTDILVTGYGRVALSRNAGERRFRDATAAAGLGGWNWSTSAAWADLDGDGFADLVLPQCAGPEPADRVFRNSGNGTFAEVSGDAGSVAGKGFAAAVCDFDDDGKPDVFVTGADGDNRLYLNRSSPGRIVLEEAANRAGLAAGGGTGVAVLDLDGTGRPSLFVTRAGGGHRVYRNAGAAAFRADPESGGPLWVNRDYSGWGAARIDWWGTGWPELAVAHGRGGRFTGESTRAQMPMRLSLPTLERQAYNVGTFFEQSQQLRGLAAGDFRGDGRAGLVASRLNGPVAVVTTTGAPLVSAWVGVRLVGRGSRDVTGAVVRLTRGGPDQTRFLTGGGYASSGDPQHVFALGGSAGLRVEVRWPHGRSETWSALPTGRYVTLRESESGGG